MEETPSPGLTRKGWNRKEVDGPIHFKWEKGPGRFGPRPQGETGNVSESAQYRFSPVCPAVSNLCSLQQFMQTERGRAERTAMAEAAAGEGEKKPTLVRIFVGGLGERVTEDELRSIFESRNLGRVEGVDIVRTKGRSFAYCNFLPSSSASLSKLFSTVLLSLPPFCLSSAVLHYCRFHVHLIETICSRNRLLKSLPISSDISWL